MYKKALLILLVGVYSCSETKLETKEQIVAVASETNYNDTIKNILNQALLTDTFEYYHWQPLISFKSGNLFNKETKNAIVVQNLKDTINIIKLYTLSNNAWTLSDSLIDSSGIYPQNYFEFIDFDFDNCNDIYINCSSTNGYSISRGILLTVDPKTFKLINHKETRNLGNISPDKKSRSVISEEIIYCAPSETANDREVCVLTHKWVKGMLKEEGRKCPCKE